MTAEARALAEISIPSVKGWSEPSFLGGAWTPAHGAPATLPVINLEIRHLTEMLEPATHEVIAAMLRESLTVFDTPKNWAKMAPTYLEALEKYPEWAIADALRSIRLDHKFFPRPAEIRAEIPEQYHRMVLAKMRLETARMIARRT